MKFLPKTDIAWIFLDVAHSLSAHRVAVFEEYVNGRETGSRRIRSQNSSPRRIISVNGIPSAKNDIACGFTSRLWVMVSLHQRTETLLHLTHHIRTAESTGSCPTQMSVIDEMRQTD